MKKTIIHVVAALLLPALLFTTQGCADEAVVPAYLRIDSIGLDPGPYDSVGSVSHKIQYAYVFAGTDQEMVGVFQLPFNVPVIREGNIPVRVYAGIADNGFSPGSAGFQAPMYVFYDFWEENATFTFGDTTVIQPHVRYKEGLKYRFFDDFEDEAQPKFEKVAGGGAFGYESNEVFEGLRSGVLSLNGDEEADLIVASSGLTIPNTELGYYLEINYKSNCDFLLGYATPDGSITPLGLRARSDWNKLYFNMTEFIVQSVSQAGTPVQLLIRVPQDTTIASQQVYIDNVKLLY